MLIRFVVNNVLSFGEQREFNMIPNTRLKTLLHHKYTKGDIELLKMSSIYGANGAGKSNLIKSIDFLRKVVTKEEISVQLKNSYFKFHEKEQSPKLLFAIEFIQDDIPFYYALEIQNGVIITEELYQSGLGKAEDKLIFERKTNANEKTDLNFFSEFEKDEKSQILKQVLIEDFYQTSYSSIKINF